MDPDLPQKDMGVLAMKDIRSRSLDMYSRLRSIDEDASFVTTMRLQYPHFPMFANLRCGAWYTDPSQAVAEAVYFKSTDGHANNWSFNLRRPNLHLLQHIISNHGIILADSTRSGKRMPDSFSKTVPIWCCVINNALAGRSGLSDWDIRLHTPPSVVGESEKSQIEANVPSWVEALLGSSYTLPTLAKPLRPIWITPSTSAAPCADNSFPFYPIICITASKVVEDGLQRRVGGYDYVQGAGDDHELWSKGLTPRMFWKYRDEIMACNRDQLDERIGKIVAQELNPSELEPWICQTDESAISAVGGRLSLRVASGPPPFAANDHRQLIYLTFSEEPETPVSNTCWIRIPENIGKAMKHQQHFQTSILPRAIASLQDITANCRVLVTSPDESVAVGVGLSILVAKYDDNGEVRGSVSRTPVTKESIKRRLEWIIRDRPSANPPRWMLRRINEYFMSPGSTLV